MEIIELRDGGFALIGKRERANYKKSEDPLYENNPFVEALPKVRTKKEVTDKLKKLPRYNESDRSRPDHLRLLAVQKIVNIVVPLPAMLELERRLTRMLYSGYMSRNPITPEWRKQIRAGFSDIDWDESDESVPFVRSAASGMCLWGISGGGKSVAIDNILGELYPQVIEHTRYKEYDFNHLQLVWLKLDCSHDGTVRGLCLNILEAFDKILRTSHFKRSWNNRTAVELLPHVSDLAGLHGLGVLVIDETQRLSVAKSGGAEEMLNFFVKLTNTVGVPVILIGTYKILKIMTKEFSISRKFSSQGDMIWSNLEENDETWDLLLETIWKYQYTKQSTPLTKDIRTAIFEESQGIIDIAVKLYMLAQWKVIGTDNEKITPQIIRGVAKESLQLCRRALQALKTKDFDVLQSYTDVMPNFQSLEAFLMKADDRTRIYGQLDTLRSREKLHKSNAEIESPLVTIAKMLVQAGYEPQIAKECAQKALSLHGSDSDFKKAIPEAFRLALTVEESSIVVTKKTKDDKKKKDKTVPLASDLRELCTGRDKKVNAYEALDKAGYIKSAAEFVS